MGGVGIGLSKVGYIEMGHDRVRALNLSEDCINQDLVNRKYDLWRSVANELLIKNNKENRDKWEWAFSAFAVCNKVLLKKKKIERFLNGCWQKNYPHKEGNYFLADEDGNQLSAKGVVFEWNKCFFIGDPNFNGFWWSIPIPGEFDRDGDFVEYEFKNLKLASRYKKMRINDEKGN